MEHRALANLAVRLIGFFEIVIALNALPAFASAYLDENSRRAYGSGTLLIGGLMGVILPVIIGLFLIYFPGIAASKVLRIEGVDSRDPRERTLLESVAIGAMGLWFSVSGVTGAAHEFAWILGWSLLADSPATMQWDTSSRVHVFSNFVAWSVQLAIGLVLLIGSKGLARVVATAGESSGRRLVSAQFKKGS